MMKTITELEEEEKSIPNTEDIASSISISDTSEVSVEAEGLHEALDMSASRSKVEKYACPVCDTVHAHDTNKHRATDSFDLSVEDTVDMFTNPNCHCFLHEAKYKSDELGIDADEVEKISKNAPIPDEFAEEIHQKFAN